MSVLDVRDVSIRYLTGDFKEISLKEYVMRRLTHDYKVNEFWADRDVSFTLEKGDMLGIIGANGAGKSTLLKVVSGIMEPTRGSVYREGSIAALLELGSGFDGDLTVRENTYLRGAMLGYTRKFMDETYNQIIAFAELEDFQDRPFKRLSSGMKSRLAFSIASLVRPDILILDEVLSVGDGAFRQKSETKMREIIDGGATTILVSHSLDQVRKMCNKVLWLHKGDQIAYGDNVQEICDRYQAFLDGKLKLPDRKKVEEVLPQGQPSMAEEPTNQQNGNDEAGKCVLDPSDHLDRKDAVSIISMSVVLFLALYVLLGFGKFGLSTPLQYGGGDNLQWYSTIKSIIDNGWAWFNHYTGAPYGSPLVDTAHTIVNFEFLVAKIISLFEKDVFTVVNIQFLLVFPACAISAFIVLRILKIKRMIALVGAALFACTPYIFARSIGHFTLTASYFIPLSILLCIWAYDVEDARYLKLGKGFFQYKKNWAAIGCALLIANNGDGYYPFFTCYFLCIVALMNLFRYRKVSALRKSLVSVALIVVFFILVLTPLIVYQYVNGANGSVVRDLSAVERHGLKIVQLFIPINNHGIELLEKFINRYNDNMPLVAENARAYLGIAGIVGFVISIFALFAPENRKGQKDAAYIQFFSKLNLFAVLFGTIGGFGSLMVVLTDFRMIRSVNRVSIFISFISICVLCICIQRIAVSLSNTEGQGVKKFLSALILICFLGICIWDLLPTYGANDAALKSNQKNYTIDENFIKDIEAQMADGDMIYQLPYHVYPESGRVNKMGDYQLFTGYLHSDTLRWSYGGIRGRDADLWNAHVDSLPMGARINTIIGAGFKGIYIDSRAYTDEELEELRLSIEAIISEQPHISENGLLLFYNLYPFITSHPEFADPDYLSHYKLGSTVFFDDSINDAHLYFTDGIARTETDYAWMTGNETTFSLPLTGEIAGDLVLQINLKRIYQAPKKMIVKCDDTVLFDETINTPDEPVLISIPKECVHDGSLDLSFLLPDAVSPKSLGLSSDSRNLSFGVASFSLNYAE